MSIKTSVRIAPRCTVLICVALMISPLPALAADKAAKPNASLVSRYTRDVSAREAKLAECKEKYDPAGFRTDVACVSADQADRKADQAKLTSNCNAGDTFVFIPPRLKGQALEDYLVKNAPSDETLKDCKQTREQWLREKLNSLPK